MKLFLSRSLLALLLSAGVVRAEAPIADQPVAAAEELKSEAFKALRGGQFETGYGLLCKAASIAPDPTLAKMVNWTSQFEAQRQTFAAERKKSFDKAVADVHLLIKHHKEDFAVDSASRAYGLAADKKAFDEEPWVKELVASAVSRGTGYENSEQWVKALRVYSDLGALQPANPEWKEHLKSATRRVRLLAFYAPDELKEMQEGDVKERNEVEVLLRTEKDKATSRPATEPVANDSFKTDWHDTLRDVKYSMLREAMADVRMNYFRDISYKNLMIGGLRGLQALATTGGLEKAFPTLNDPAKKKAFLDRIGEDLEKAQAVTPENEKLRMSNLLARLKSINDDTLQLDEGVIVSEFADGAFSELDPFSSMIWPAETEEFAKTTQGEFSGVGIQIQTDDEGNLKVVSPIEDSPAYKARIKAGDIITQINDKNAKGITTTQAVKHITGKEGTEVALTIRSLDGSVRIVKLMREKIKVGSVKGYSHRVGGGWEYFVDPQEQIAYLRITNFTRTTSDELDKAVSEIREKGGKGIILDLRYNPGGLLTAATEVSDKFLHEGVIVSTRADRETPNQPTVTTARGDDDETNVPLVVLVNQYSASASEIVSGALKDQKRAIVVGERTFGKGSVQMLFPIASRSALLKLTTSHYYLPLGKCIHREENSTDWGVDPDVKVEMAPEQMRAAIDARQALDVLRDVEEGKTIPVKSVEVVKPPVQDGTAISTTVPTTQEGKKDLLSMDPQLSAAMLVLRLKLAGAAL